MKNENQDKEKLKHNKKIPNALLQAKTLGKWKGKKQQQKLLQFPQQLDVNRRGKSWNFFFFWSFRQCDANNKNYGSKTLFSTLLKLIIRKKIS